MSKSVLMSIRPKWCELIASGKKTMEIRKSRPKLETPFKCYIYCTNGAPYLNRHNGKLYLEPKDFIGGQGYGLYERLSGKVIGEFVCDNIQWGCGSDLIVKEDRERATKGSCVSREELFNYLGIVPGTSAYDKRCEFYGWRISDLVIYDEPRLLRDFTPCCEFLLDEKQCDYRKIECFYQRGAFFEDDGCDCVNFVNRPPKSWIYVEELE